VQYTDDYHRRHGVDRRLQMTNVTFVLTKKHRSWVEKDSAIGNGLRVVSKLKS